MSVAPTELLTERLTLRQWRDDDRAPLAAMNADPEVMRDFGRTFERDESDRKFDRFANAFETHGYGRWVVEGSIDGDPPEFLGYTGVMPVRSEHPLGPHEDVGWRLRRTAWGHGFACEAARAALEDAFGRVGLDEVFAYTAPDNIRSQAVMERLGLRRDPSLDFSIDYEMLGEWSGLVWVADSPR